MAERPLRLHDSLSGQVQELRPRDPGKASIYVCGPTVYARIHVGNARPFVVFALLKRLLEHEGYSVTLVENITDVNDKIYDAARERGVQSAELARAMTEAYREDTDRLALGRPDHEPLASETVDAIVELIQALIDRGHAYVSGGDVYFSVRSFPGYGKLSNRRLEELTPRDTGEPEEERPSKRDPLDFALWKAQKEGEDTSWEAPWGRGRPGWHIECSAMAESILGLGFDIHGGGADLLFPHHENEIAQTEAGRGGRPLARVWVHNGMVRFGEEKMSKSVGNVRLLRDGLDQFGRDALVMYFLAGHYRQPLAFTGESLERAQRSVERVANFCRLLGRVPEAAAVAEEGSDPAVIERRDAFFDALRDDFNTPQALAALFELISEGNRRLEEGQRFAGAGEALAEMLPVIGLENLLAPEQAADDTVRRLAEERERARREGRFDRADALRRQIAERGWQVRDTADGPVLVPAREGGPVQPGGR
jgi:cysteinyl-tRNA synthetase